MSGKSQSNEDIIIQELSKKIEELRKELPDGELTSLLSDVRIVVDNQEQIKNNVERLTETIMDPEQGIIVRVNKNTEYRKMLEGHERDNATIIEEHQNLVKWKSTVDKFLWILTTALIGIVVKLLFFSS